MIYTTLVNRENPIKESFQNKITLIPEKEFLVEEETLSHFLKLKEKLSQENIMIEIDSAYRSVAEQEEIYQKTLLEKGEEIGKAFVAEPRCSEHHTGCAIDIGIVAENDFITEENDSNQELWKRIHEVLKDFGFILRYPKGKEQITGYSYEPWHIRYVGEFPAKIITENHLTLEEYLSSYGCILYINKEQGCTSFDVVNEISHLYGIKKVGHTGTLDPMATGVLLVAVGKATKIIELLTAYDKEYIATAQLGYETDTFDTEGAITKKKEVPKNLDIISTVKSFQKTYQQEVPIYSAVKVNGKKLYDYARKKESVELPKKEVTIKEIEVLSYNQESFTIRALVSKGCYIRSLIRDIGLSLGTYATMSSLKRTKQGNISLDNTCTLKDLKEGNYQSYFIEEVLDYPKIVVNSDLAFQLRNGVKVKNKWNVQEKVLFVDENNQLIGIYEIEEDKLKVWKNFS